MNASVVVAHASRQHSHQLAAALHAHGALHEYWTGLRPDARTALPEERIRVLSVGAAAHAVERWVLPGQGESVFGQMGDYMVDKMYARWLREAPPSVTAVVGYENASLALFDAARARGILTILDAASVHHAAGDRWMGAPAISGWARDVRARKDDELQAADHVLVLSELARESYVAAGVAPERISVVPPGYDAEVFQASGEVRAGDPLRFVFAGNTGHRKGFDVLLDAAARLADDGARFRLVVVGDVPASLPRAVERRGKLAPGELAAEFARADCLVLPSRCDAFGLVVAEALGSGVPAIVSEHVGASDLVRESGAGWVVAAGDAAALAACMQACIDDREGLLEAKRRARAAAGSWTWGRYRQRAAETVLGLLAHD